MNSDLVIPCEILLVPKFVAAISTSGVGVGNRLMAGCKLGVLKMGNFGWAAGKFT